MKNQYSPNMRVIRHKAENGYTIVNNKLIRDERLTFEALGLMVYLLSLPDSWHLTVKGLAATTQNGVRKISNAMDTLRECGYLNTAEIRKNGRYSSVFYLLNDDPDAAEKNENDTEDVRNADCGYEPETEITYLPAREEAVPAAIEASEAAVRHEAEQAAVPQKKTARKVVSRSSMTHSMPQSTGTTEFSPCTQKSYTEKSARINKERIITPSNGNLSILQVCTSNGKKENGKKEPERLMDYRQRENAFKRAYYRRYGADLEFLTTEDETMATEADDLIGMMADVCACPHKAYRINGNLIAGQAVAARLEQVTPYDLIAVIHGIHKVSGQIRNIRAYSIAALYNAVYSSHIGEFVGIEAAAFGI